jgi:CBS-domain-containing membrane protein
MPPRGRPKTELVLSDEEREVLERLTRRRKSAQALALRARIILACAVMSRDIVDRCRETSWTI